MSTRHTDPSPALRISELDRFSAYRASEGGQRDAPGEILNLSNNEVMISPLPAVAEELRRIGTDVNLYPDPTARTLRLRLAEHFGAEEEETMVGPGSAGVLQQLLLALCGEGDEVLYAWPGFDAYPLLIAVSGATGVPVPLTPSGDHDLRQLLAKVNSRTQAVILCSPHNPTGSRITRQTLRWFLDNLPSHVVAVLDQAYMEFDAEEDQRDLGVIREHRNVVLLRTFSKAHGLAGLRVGYAFASAEIVDRARKAGIPFSITRTGERAAVASLEQQEALAARVATIRRLRAALVDGLAAEGLGPKPSAGNFVWLPLGPSSERFAASALRAGVRVRAFPDLGVRISVGTEHAHHRVLAAARSHRSG